MRRVNITLKAPLTIIKELLKEEKPNRQWYSQQSDIELQIYTERFINLKTEEKFPSSSLGKNLQQQQQQQIYWKYN